MKKKTLVHLKRYKTVCRYSINVDIHLKALEGEKEALVNSLKREEEQKKIIQKLTHERTQLSNRAEKAEGKEVIIHSECL